MSSSDTSCFPARPKETRYLSFDFWRGAACLMLLCYHAVFFADRGWEMHDRGTWTLGSIAVRIIGWLWGGVPMFFVVSGYCIAGSLDSLRRKPMSLGEYFLRRIRRIYPPLWIMLGIATVFSLAAGCVPALAENCPQLPNVAEFSLANWFGNVTASEAWLHGLAGHPQPTYLMANTWTLCYEEQFYAVAGLLLLFSAKRLFLGAGLVTVLTLVCRHACRIWDIPTQGFFFDGHWLMFAAGFLVYQTVNYGTPRGRGISVGVLLTGMAYAFLDRRTQTEHVQRHLDEYIFIACGFAASLIVCRRWDRWLSERTWVQPIAACGRMSYSIYLTHYLWVVSISCLFSLAGVRADGWVALLVVPSCLALSIPPAILFHRFVELPFMNAPGKSVEVRTSKSATTTAVLTS